MFCLKYNDDKYCRNQAPLFLLIGGGITVGMTALKLISFLTPCEFDDKVNNWLFTSKRLLHLSWY